MVTVVRRLVPCLALVLLALGQAAAQEQQTTITGRVVGAAGTPLAAADVRVPSLYVAAVTRDDGTYSLILPAGRVSGQPVAVTALPDMPVEDAYRLMEEEDVERLPVTEDGRLVGVLSRSALTRRLAEDEPPDQDSEPPT